MGMALAAVADNRDLLVGDQVHIRVGVVIDFHVMVLRMILLEIIGD